MINEIQLRQISPVITRPNAQTIAALLDKICPSYGMDTVDKFDEFLANVLHESNSFKTLVESLNYQAVALTKKFGRHRISIDDCYRYGRTMKQKANQPAIANILYGGAWGKENLGNIYPTDGWDLRGSGPMQITGRGLGEEFRIFINKKLGTNYTLHEVFALLRTDIGFGIHAACWVFVYKKKLLNYAIEDKILVIRKSINGGTFGILEVEKFYGNCKKYL